jgi:hypothetical protein
MQQKNVTRGTEVNVVSIELERCGNDPSIRVCLRKCIQKCTGSSKKRWLGFCYERHSYVLSILKEKCENIECSGICILSSPQSHRAD